jgi:hypothetical protein
MSEEYLTFEFRADTLEEELVLEHLKKVWQQYTYEQIERLLPDKEEQ